MLVGYPTRTEWIESYNSLGTRNVLKSGLNYFDKLLKSWNISEKEFFEQAKKIDEHEVLLILDRIKNYLEKGLAHKTGKVYFSVITTWFRINGMRLDDKIIQKRIRWNKPLKEMKQIPDRATIQKFIDISPLKYKVFFYMAIATGARQSEILGLKVKDIDFRQKVPTVHFEAINTKTKQERYSFLTPEASEILQRYIEGKSYDSKIFTIHRISLQKHFDRCRERLGLVERYATKTHKISIHRLRAYTKRELSKAVGDDMAHVILGHAEGLATYDADNLEGMMLDYEKAIPGLTIGIHAKDKARMTNQEEKIKLMAQEIELLKRKINHNDDEPNELEDK